MLDSSASCADLLKLTNPSHSPHTLTWASIRSRRRDGLGQDGAAHLLPGCAPPAAVLDGPCLSLIPPLPSCSAQDGYKVQNTERQQLVSCRRRAEEPGAGSRAAPDRDPRVAAGELAARAAPLGAGPQSAAVLRARAAGRPGGAHNMEVLVQLRTRCMLSRSMHTIVMCSHE